MWVQIPPEEPNSEVDYASAGRKHLGKNFKRMYPLYEYFARGWKDCLDFSDESLFDLYLYESQGKGTVRSNNGFAHGKKWLNVTIAMWLEDIEKGNLFKSELYEDPDLPHWWLDMVLK